MAAERTRTPPDPDWASLTPDLWRHVLWSSLASSRLALRQAGSTAPDQKAWMPWCRQVVAASAVCKSLRAALFGPDAGEMWDFVVLSCSHLGVVERPPSTLDQIKAALGLRKTVSASQQLNQLAVSQAQHARRMKLQGGGWLLRELQKAVAPMSGLEFVELRGLHDSAEAACISTALAGSAVDTVRLTECSVAFAFPASVRHVEVMAARLKRTDCEQQFSYLQSLANLHSLYMPLSNLYLTRVHMQSIMTWHPELYELCLVVHVGAGQETVSTFSELSGVRLHIFIVWGQAAGLVALFQQLKCVHIRVMSLFLDADNVTAAVEAQLAQCNISKELYLCWNAPPSRRLQHQPSRARVVYDNPEDRVRMS